MPYRYIYVYLFCIAVFPIAIGNLPPVGSIRGVRTLGLSDSVTTPPLPALDDCVTIVAVLPPVPAKLVSRIEAGEYKDMTELLPDLLGTYHKITSQ